MKLWLASLWNDIMLFVLEYLIFWPLVLLLKLLAIMTNSPGIWTQYEHYVDAMAELKAEDAE